MGEIDPPVRLLWGVAVLATVCWAIGARFLGTPTGVRQQIFDEPGLVGRVLRDRIVPRIDGGIIGSPSVPRHNYSVKWAGYWYVENAGEYDMYLGADDAADLRIDGRVVHARNADAGFGTTAVVLGLAAGAHAIDVTFDQYEGGAFLNVLVAPRGGDPRLIASDALFPSAPDASDVTRNRWLDRARRLVVALDVLAAVALVGSLGARREQQRRERRLTEPARDGGSVLTLARTRWLRTSALIGAGLLVTSWAGALRFAALDAKYGPLERPLWASAVSVFLDNHIGSWRPESLSWGRVEKPYVGGDPVNYLKFAREMQGFYQAHVREPVFLATTRLFLRLLDGQDVAVSFASALFSTLLVGATFLLGVQTFGFWPALIASLALGGESMAIDIGVDGWRDDAAAASFVLSACTLLWLRNRPTWPRAVAAGVIGAGACLTRITSALFWVPALAWGLITAPGSGPTRVRLGLVALTLTAVLVAPYVINCAKVYGDPLYALNYHTRFYRAREHADYKEAMSASSYIGRKFVTDPWRTTSTLLRGVTVYPFANKWNGFQSWGRPTGRALACASLLGLALFLTSAVGRFLLGMSVLYLLPFAFTWNISGGEEWRFTLAVYPILLLAAGLGITRFLEFAGRAAIRYRSVVTR